MEHAVAPSLNRTAFQATIHCLTGCAIGEVLGLVIATALGWHDLPSIVLAVVLAFGFGYGLTLRPLLAGGMAFRGAMRIALAADTVSIVVMETTDNAIVLAGPRRDGSRIGRRPVLVEPRAVTGARVHRGVSGKPLADCSRPGSRRPWLSLGP
jgi:hypothetical protein